MFFFSKPKVPDNSSPEQNLHEEPRSDDDSFATRSSRTIGFVDEPAPVPVPEVDYSTRHSRSFLDAVNFDEDDIGETTEEGEDLTDSQREARFKAAEVAELTDSQRENRANFLNESLVAQGVPTLGSDQGSSHHSRSEHEGLLAGGPQHKNLMIEEGITMNLLDATDRYQDNFVADATKLAMKRNRFARYSRMGILFLAFSMLVAVGSIILVDVIEKREAKFNNNSLKPGHTTPVETIGTPSADPGEFYELEIKFPGAHVDNNKYGSQEVSHNPNKNPQKDNPSKPSSSWLSCEDNPDFLHNGENGQNCEWVSLDDTVARCTRQGVKENCQATCDPSCSNPTSFPTENPTDAPSDDEVASAEATPHPTYLTYAPTAFPTEVPTKLLKE